jgi:HB1, ASXL, restriction endonuclease HTH domain
MQSNEKQTVQFQNRLHEHVEREHQTYLRVAEIVLASALSPLKAREIVERGIERGLFGDHTLSRTPEKSMQARLSMDILNGVNNSKFARTERGRFTLRSNLLEAAGFPEDTNSIAQISEYVAERRILRTPKEEVLCASEDAFSDVLTFQGIDTDASPILARLLDDESVPYVSRSEAELRNDAKQFVTYVLVQCGQRLLFFKRSYLSRAAEFLRGSKCIGFGGWLELAIDAAVALFDAARVPGQVEMEEVRAMRLEVQALAGRVRGEQDAQRVLRGVGVEPALDLLASGAAREAVDHLDTLFGAVAALNRLLEDRFQIALRALAVFGKDQDAAVVPLRRLALCWLAVLRQFRAEIFADPIDQLPGLGVGQVPRLFGDLLHPVEKRLLPAPVGFRSRISGRFRFRRDGDGLDLYRLLGLELLRRPLTAFVVGVGRGGE